MGTIDVTQAELEDTQKEANDAHVPLSFISPLENREAAVEETVEFLCEMTHPGLHPTWLKDNQPLSLADSRYQIVNRDSTYQLIIPSVVESDRGEYTVQFGDLQSTAVLSVQGQLHLLCSAAISKS